MALLNVDGSVPYYFVNVFLGSRYLFSYVYSYEANCKMDNYRLLKYQK